MASVQDRTMETAHQYFDLYQKLDTRGVIDLFDDDIYYVIPFSADGGLEPWAEFRGKAAASGHVDEIGGRYASIAFKDTQFTESLDKRWVFFEATGNLVANDGNKPYQNKYIIKLGVKDGKITHIYEYANPVTFANLTGQKTG